MHNFTTALLSTKHMSPQLQRQRSRGNQRTTQARASLLIPRSRVRAYHRIPEQRLRRADQRRFFPLLQRWRKRIPRSLVADRAQRGRGPFQPGDYAEGDYPWNGRDFVVNFGDGPSGTGRTDGNTASSPAVRAVGMLVPAAVVPRRKSIREHT